MLTLPAGSLPQSLMSYVAFRVSFLETLERIALSRQFESGTPDGFGYLTEIPFLIGVPPHVQLDVLAETWSRHLSAESHEATLIDESVAYAVCETAAGIVERDPTFFLRIMKVGPLNAAILPDHFAASELRSLHQAMGGNGDFLMISQFEDMPPETSARLKRQFQLDPERLEPLFDLLGRWRLQDNLLTNLNGLLSDNELRRVGRMLNLRQPAH